MRQVKRVDRHQYPKHAQPANLPNSIRGGSGLGDSLYMIPIVQYFLKLGEKDLTVNTNYGDIFKNIFKDQVKVSAFSRQARRHAVYSMRRSVPGTTQWEDVCHQVGLSPKDVDYHSGWEIANKEFIDEIKSRVNKPILFILEPRKPMARPDSWGSDVAPDYSVLDSCLAGLTEYHRLLVCHDAQTYSLVNYDEKIRIEKLTALIDLAVSCEGIIGQQSFIIPLGEIFKIKTMCVWSSKLKHTKDRIMRTMQPKKIIHNHVVVGHVWDDAPVEESVGKVKEFFRCS